jgi:hypothetical protein
MVHKLRDPLHKVIVRRDATGWWYAHCETCGHGLQHHVIKWFVHPRWPDALETALRHNLDNRWMRT